MTRRKLAPLLAVGLLLVLHLDLWLADQSQRVLGLPVSLAYHLASCLAASLLFAWLVRVWWREPR